MNKHYLKLAGICSDRLKQYEKAYKYYSLLIDVDPDSDISLYKQVLWILQNKVDDDQRYISLVDKAIKRYPDESGFYEYKIDLIKTGKGPQDSLFHYYDKVLALDSSNLVARYNYAAFLTNQGTIFHKHGDDDKANDFFERAKELILPVINSSDSDQDYFDLFQLIQQNLDFINK